MSRWERNLTRALQRQATDEGVEVASGVQKAAHARPPRRLEIALSVADQDGTVPVQVVLLQGLEDHSGVRLAVGVVGVAPGLHHRVSVIRAVVKGVYSRTLGR